MVGFILFWHSCQWYQLWNQVHKVWFLNQFPILHDLINVSQCIKQRLLQIEYLYAIRFQKIICISDLSSLLVTEESGFGIFLIIDLLNSVCSELSISCENGWPLERAIGRLLVMSLQLSQEVVTPADFAAYINLHEHVISDGANGKFKSSSDLKC